MILSYCDNKRIYSNPVGCLTSPAFFQAIEPEPAVRWFAPYKNAIIFGSCSETEVSEQHLFPWPGWNREGEPHGSIW